jgi:hypothetical protein
MTITYACKWDVSDVYSSLEDPRLEHRICRKVQAGRFRETYWGRMAMLTPVEVRIALQTLESLWEQDEVDMINENGCRVLKTRTLRRTAERRKIF